ncbi:hypothetical protein NQ314_007643 [Rhamnusium bicolor]|uniref:Peptidase S1 domain-containing protein n=1 Tax=Rhamnusium bicolor TaxID=1586634 RepID=A0AAV8YJJ5_9CUCU|nr:hypothetical protein NQ314_007643 [Rhamnusium bicolor]
MVRLYLLKGEAKLVRLGDLDLATESDDAAPQDFTIKRAIPHPDYKRPARYHDIGLIELDRQVELTAYVGIACLDTERKHNESSMKATGWGKRNLVAHQAVIF